MNTKQFLLAPAMRYSNISLAGKKSVYFLLEYIYVSNSVVQYNLFDPSNTNIKNLQKYSILLNILNKHMKCISSWDLHDFYSKFFSLSSFPNSW